MKEKFIIQMFFSTSSQVLRLLASILLLQHVFISESILGIYAMVLSIGGFFTLFLDVGITTIHFQYSSRENFQTYFGSFFAIKFLLIGINYAIPFLAMIFIDMDPTVRLFITINFLSGIFAGVTGIFNANLQVRLKVFKLEFSTFCVQLLNTILIIILVQGLILISDPLIWVFLVTLLTSVLNLIAAIMLNAKEEIFQKPIFSLMKGYIRDTKPYIVQSIISVISLYLGNLILGFSKGNAELGQYYLVQNYIISFFLAISRSINMSFYSIFPTYFAKKDYGTIQAIANRFEKYASILFLLVFIIVFLYADLIFDLIPFLNPYKPATVYLKVLIVSPYLDAICRPYLGHLSQSNQQALSAKFAIITVISSLVLTILLVPNSIGSLPLAGLGAWGLIIIDIIFGIENNVLFKYITKKKYNITSNDRKNIIHVLIAIASIVLSLIVNVYIFQILISNTLVLLVVSSCTSISIYILGLVLCKEFTKEDVRYFLSILIRKKIIPDS